MADPGDDYFSITISNVAEAAPERIRTLVYVGAYLPQADAPALVDVIAGQCQLIFATSLSVIPHIKSGKVRALAVTTTKRWPELPDVPTVAESGFPGYEANTWNGMLAPAGTPRAIVMRLNQEMMKILSLREVIEYMTADGAEPAGNTPEHFAAYIRSEHAKWAKVIKAANVQTD